MGSRRPAYPEPPSFDEVKDQLLRASSTLAKTQLLDLADFLHDLIRSRQASACGREVLAFVELEWRERSCR